MEVLHSELSVSVISWVLPVLLIPTARLEVDRSRGSSSYHFKVFLVYLVRWKSPTLIYDFFKALMSPQFLPTQVWSSALKPFTFELASAFRSLLKVRRNSVVQVWPVGTYFFFAFGLFQARLK